MDISNSLISNSLIRCALDAADTNGLTIRTVRTTPTGTLLVARTPKDTWGIYTHSPADGNEMALRQEYYTLAVANLMALRSTNRKTPPFPPSKHLP